MTKGSLDEPLHTNIYTSMLTQTGMYALYFHTTELSNGQMFHKVQSYQVTFIWPVRGNVESKWTCQCFDSENCSIWVGELDSGSDKVICHKHWHGVDWKERWPWKMVCVYFEWCNIWGGSLPTVQIASKVTSIDLDIAPSESASGEPYHSSSVSEAGTYWNIQQQWYFCAHSTVQSFLGMKLNRH